MRSFRIHRVRAKKKEASVFLFYRSAISHAEGSVSHNSILRSPLAVKQLLVEDLLQKILQFLVQAAYLFIYEGCSSEVFELATFS